VLCLPAEAHAGETGGLVMITVKHAAFSYDGRNELFSDLSFSLMAGEVLTILGRNGIGKTTFLRCLLGILPWTRGECLVDGQRPDPAAVSDVIGYVPQSHVPAFPYTVFEMVMMGRARRIGLFRTPAAADRARVAELLDLVGVLPLADRAATELSEAAKEENKSINRIRQVERADHRPHQVLENPPHTLQETPGSIRTDHHRRTRTLCLQNHPLNNLHYSHNQESAAILLTVIHDF
ncbi:MAG: ABC transporter ATP-binding protein, partial [Actinomyces dentalis]